MFLSIKNISKDILPRPPKIVLAIFPEGCESIVCTKSAEWKVSPCEYIRLLGTSNSKNKTVASHKVPVKDKNIYFPHSPIEVVA